MVDTFDTPREDPEAKLERAFMEEYLRARHHSFADLGELTEPERKHLLDDAAIYAARRLADIGARAHYVEDLHRHQ